MNAIISRGILAEKESNRLKTQEPVLVAKHREIRKETRQTIPVIKNTGIRKGARKTMPAKIKDSQTNKEGHNLNGQDVNNIQLPIFFLQVQKRQEDRCISNFVFCILVSFRQYYDSLKQGWFLTNTTKRYMLKNYVYCFIIQYSIRRQFKRLSVIYPLQVFRPFRKGCHFGIFFSKLL